MSTTDDPRYIPPTVGFFTTLADIAPERLGAVEGVKPKGKVEVRRAMVGKDILMLHVLREKGLIDPVHKHDDHETVAYLIRGKLRLVIGGEEFIATAGTSWIHPPGVEHFSEALEDCEQLEIKSPPKKTWVTVERERAMTISTWTATGEFDLSTENLRLLLDNRIPVIRIPGFATAHECESFVAAARSGHIKYYSVATKIGYIGMAQYEYRWGRPKEEFFSAVPEAWQHLNEVITRCSFNPLQRLIDRLQAVWPHPVGVAREDMGEYYAGIIRFAGEGVQLHCDWAPVNSPHYAIGQIDGQLGWNFFAEELQSGGYTTVHNAPWDPEVKPGEIPQSYGLDPSLVEGSPKAIYKATAGDVVIFNTRNPHEIAGGVAKPGGSRISIGSFVGRMPDKQLVLWS